MRKYIYGILILLLSLSVFCSCSNEDLPEGPREILQISSSTLTLTVNSRQNLTVSSNLTDSPKIKWTSTSPDIASVDENGTVTALSLGTATVIAESELGAVKYCVINVAPRELAFEELVDFQIKGLPAKVDYYNKQTGELISSSQITSFDIKTEKDGDYYYVYCTLKGVKLYDKDGENGENPILIKTAMYREGGENCNIDNFVKVSNKNVGESFEIKLRDFRVLLNYEQKRELEIRIDARVEQ
jgi:hypothetical protein